MSTEVLSDPLNCGGDWGTLGNLERRGLTALRARPAVCSDAQQKAVPASPVSTTQVRGVLRLAYSCLWRQGLRQERDMGAGIAVSRSGGPYEPKIELWSLALSNISRLEMH